MKQLTVLILFLLLICSPGEVKSTHLMGGELTYKYDGSSIGGSYYIVTLVVYRYCDSSVVTPAPLDGTMKLGIFLEDSLNPNDTVFIHNSIVLYLKSATIVESFAGNPNCTFQPTACIEQGIYEDRIFLFDRPVSYFLFVERCCRNGGIINLINPGAAGMSFFTTIPPFVNNSSPEIADLSVPYICVNDTVTIINNAYDPDGDSLVYSFVTPYNGVSGSLGNAPDPIDYNPYILPVSEVNFAPGFSYLNPFGAGGFATIDPFTGLTQYFVPNQGFYVATIEIKEYRNGVFISAIRRDLQFITIPCLPNPAPVFNSLNPGGIYTVQEGQQICFTVSATDSGGDSLFLTSQGTLLNSTYVNPPGIIPDASGAGFVSSQFCWTPICGMSRSAPYQFVVLVNDNGCPVKIRSRVISVYVTPGLPSIIPTISISQTPPGLLCQNSTVTLHANTDYPGSNPQFIWFVNGLAIPALNDSLYTTTQLNDGDIVSVTVISDEVCLIVDTASSPPFIMNVDSQLAPEITITSVPFGHLCAQQPGQFTSVVSNAGNSPSYQWYLNGTPSGLDQPDFSVTGLYNSVVVYATVTPSTGCPPENSNVIALNVYPTIIPSVQLISDVVDSICPGQIVTFTANSNNTGGTSYYSWTLNGAPVAGNTNTISLTNLQDGDSVNVSFTSNYPCLSPSFDVADPIILNQFPELSGDMTDGPLEICYGLPVMLEMIASGGKWYSYNYSWSASGSVDYQTTIFPEVSGYYFAMVDDGCYNPVEDSIYIEVLPVPIANFRWTPELPSVFFPYVQFTDQSYAAISWNWNFGDGTFSQEQHPGHLYSVTGFVEAKLVVMNDFGCFDSVIHKLEIENFTTLYVPNTFTPNGDGINDEFGPLGNSENGYEMSIFNRWGQEIFKTSGTLVLWKGTGLNGENAPVGTYIYFLKTHAYKSGKLLTGTINLVR